MESYEELRSRWRDRLQKGSSHHNFDLSRLAPNKFLVLWHDFGCSGTCSSSTELIGSFQNAKDFLAFLRFAELPRILDYASGDYRDVPNIGDSYILGLEPELRNKVDWLLGLVDRSLKGDAISELELSRIFAKFNEAFSSTNPTVQVLAFGNLADVLRSDAMQEKFECAMTDEEERLSTELKALLRDGQFDEANGRHLALARSFLTAQVSL